MNEKVKKDTGFKIIGGYVGKYTISYLEKIYSVEFPVENTLEENLDTVNKLRDEIIKGIAVLAKKKKEEEAKKKEEKKK